MPTNKKKKPRKPKKEKTKTAQNTGPGLYRVIPEETIEYLRALVAPPKKTPAKTKKKGITDGKKNQVRQTESSRG